MSVVAIYARKSVYREDSISVESQIEMCRYEARGEEAVIYQDNGYSGKNTVRPDFQRMMTDIRARKINKVIVYKLDRISRSILDFSEMMDEFQKYGVSFVSATEKFDTSSPMGRAMLNICIVFAQLERETIQQRVADTYDSRSKKGFYMGGTVPYGYTKAPTVINGINTSMYVAEPTEADDVKTIYELYSRPSATLGDVLRVLTKDGSNLNNRGKYWNTARLSELIRNPVYVIADADIYAFYKEQKANICNSIEDFDGEHSCYLFSGSNTNRKTWDLEGQNLVIAPHKGFIPSELWLACRKKLLANHQVKTAKVTNTWLAGKVKCGYCGYAMVIKKSQTKAGRYFVCSGRINGVHKTKLPTVYADKLEELIMNKLAEKIDTLTVKAEAEHITHTEETDVLSRKIFSIDDTIDSLVDKLADAEETAVTYINRKIQKLDSEKRELEKQRSKLKENRDSLPDNKVLTNVMDSWEKLTFEDKCDVAELLIDKIIVYPDRIDITWKI